MKSNYIPEDYLYGIVTEFYNLCSRTKCCRCRMSEHINRPMATQGNLCLSRFLYEKLNKSNI